MNGDRPTDTWEDGPVMNPASDGLGEFRAKYLDYVEGHRDTPPTPDPLSGEERRAAEEFIDSHNAAAGIDPYASRPPTDQLLAGIRQARSVKSGATVSRIHTPEHERLPPAARHKRLRSAVPLAEIRKRGWIPDTDDLDEIEAAVCGLLEIRHLGESPSFAVAARRSNRQEQITQKQTAWLGRLRRIAEQQNADRFDSAALESAACRLPREIRSGPASLCKTTGILAECGVRLVYLEGLKGGKLDGAVTFIDERMPVIGLTARGDRFDSLLFTLLHECAHLTLGHIDESTSAILDDLSQKNADPAELGADSQASEWLFPGGLDWKATTGSLIDDTARHYSVHPSCVIGRLQHDSDQWSFMRRTIPKVRDALRDADLLAT